ncbi:MAG: LLM class flavin-dependent oxidoreductase [Dehalococcoidia bacterium]|nr:LLM class flavin-dependent oxidoreductase [Dehalococcoidia bacterium]
MPFQGVVMHGPSVHNHVDIAKLGDELGFDDAWVTEVMGPDAVTVIAGAACATERIGFKTGIVSTYTRSPYLAAMTANSLQDLSGGRFALGIGTSTPAIVTNWHGLPWSKPLGTTREFVDLFRRMSAGERVKHEGIYNVRGATLRPATHPVPVYLAGLNPQMLELAGEIADGVILNFPTPSYAKRAVESIERGIAKAGRQRSEVDIAAFLRTAVTDDFDPAAQTIRKELITYFLAPVYQRVFNEDGYAEDNEAVNAAWSSGDRAGAVEKISDRMVDDHAVIGDVSRCHAKAQGILDAGVDRTILFPIAPEGTDAHPTILDTVRKLAPAQV